MNISISKVRWLLPIVIGVLGLAAIACGSDEETPVPTRGPIVTPTPTPSGSSAAVSPSTGPPTAVPLPAQQPPQALVPALTPLDSDIGFAPELVGITDWINTEPLTLQSVRGKALLVQFWSYSSDMWLRTLPQFNEWHAKYGPHGLVVLGVHSPEYQFEKDRANLDAAIARHGVNYPIAIDNNLESWKVFSGFVRPTMYIVDKDGKLNGIQIGDGGYQEIETAIREMLAATGADLSAVPISDAPDPVLVEGAIDENSDTSLTRRLYTGINVNYPAITAVMTGDTRAPPPYIQLRDYYQIQDSNNEYEDSPGEHINQYLYMNGLWYNNVESLDHQVDSPDYDDYLAFVFFAKGVNVVMGNKDEPREVRITMDGGPLAPDQAGKDIRFDADGNSYVLIDHPDLYQLVELEDFGTHELQLRANKPGISVYSFSFHAYVNFP